MVNQSNECLEGWNGRPIILQSAATRSSVLPTLVALTRNRTYMVSVGLLRYQFYRPIDGGRDRTRGLTKLYGRKAEILSSQRVAAMLVDTPDEKFHGTS